MAVDEPFSDRNDQCLVDNAKTLEYHWTKLKECMETLGTNPGDEITHNAFVAQTEVAAKDMAAARNRFIQLQEEARSIHQKVLRLSACVDSDNASVESLKRLLETEKEKKRKLESLNEELSRSGKPVTTLEPFIRGMKPRRKSGKIERILMKFVMVVCWPAL
ncbi:hypothetical protein HK104_002265 [Borealophlyctis nickersoniae]|nr:hypothetical protein HK104_002265 [Borealophlyctis nickersoniae]